MTTVIDNRELRELCRIGQGAECCRFLMCGAGGFECGKHTEFADILNQRVEIGDMNARGDNCEGKKP